MGLVYRAYHVHLERTGALKVLQGMAPDPDTTARFRHEAQAIAQMRHPNIVNVYDFGEHEGVPYMIIEYVPGGSLANRLSQGPLDNATALKYLRGIAAGLDHAHGLGIVHRDVKPANVLLEKDDTPVLADFGLAKLLQGSSLKSMTGVTTGTPAYMAPEQVTGNQVGPAADRYALATIAYEMLTGVIPFVGEGLMELLYAHVHREPTPPSARNRTLGPRVDAVIMRGLAKDPAARWESCAAMVEALSAALANRPEPAAARTLVITPRAAAVPFAEPLAATAIVAPPFVDAEAPSDPMAVAYPSPPAPVVKRRSRKRLIAIAAIVLILLLLIAAAGLLALRPQPGMSLTPSSVAAGSSILVTASHLPANQTGEIRLHSTLQKFPFRADSQGNVSQSITVPDDEGIGDHTIEFCWNSACRITAVLHVLEPVAPTPSPAASPTPTSSPSSSPAPTPIPVTSPSPPSKPIISVSNYNIRIGTGQETVYGLHFSPGSTVTITFVQGSLSTPTGTQTVTPSGYFSHTFSVPKTAVLGPAAVKVCGTNGCLSATVNVSTSG
jgi:serine/threonine-protein kinase